MADSPNPAESPGSVGPPAAPDDLHDPSEPFDAGQWAMHGLLSVFFESADRDRTEYVRGIIERVGRERERRELFARPGPARVGRRWILRGVAAALLAAACLLLWLQTGDQPAMAFDLREVGFQPPLLAANFWPPLLDDAERAQVEQKVADARADRDSILATGQHDQPPVWLPWSQLYRNLRSLGRWEEALAESRAFVDYARQRDQTEPDRYSPYYWALSELGEFYLALGDYETARELYQETAKVARDLQEWMHKHGRSGDDRPHALQADLAISVAPPLLMLSKLAAAEDDQDTAWEYHRQAEALLLDYFRMDCQYRGLNVPPEASLYDHCMAAAEAPDTAFESLAVCVRELLLNEAMLLRLDRDLDGAAEALERARTIPYYPYADTFRQDFHVPMETLRIAIARGDWQAALAAADEAAQHTGPRIPPGFPYQEPIAVLARAELRFLRGVALAGLDPTDPDALNLIEPAIQGAQRSAAALTQAHRERVLQRFADWTNVAGELRQ